MVEQDPLLATIMLLPPPPPPVDEMVICGPEGVLTQVILTLPPAINVGLYVESIRSVIEL
jgi:hypothetical protein